MKVLLTKMSLVRCRKAQWFEILTTSQIACDDPVLNCSALTFIELGLILILPKS